MNNHYTYWKIHKVLHQQKKGNFTRYLMSKEAWGFELRFIIIQFSIRILAMTVEFFKDYSKILVRISLDLMSEKTETSANNRGHSRQLFSAYQLFRSEFWNNKCRALTDENWILSKLPCFGFKLLQMEVGIGLEFFSHVQIPRKNCV